MGASTYQSKGHHSLVQFLRVCRTRSQYVFDHFDAESSGFAAINKPIVRFPSIEDVFKIDKNTSRARCDFIATISTELASIQTVVGLHGGGQMIQ